MNKEMQWTHQGLRIIDVRKNGNLYILMVSGENAPETPMTIQSDIFEERLRSYFLRNTFSRSDIMSVNWNMYITRGYFLKIKGSNAQKFEQNPDKFYISYLEIEGPLGTFKTIYKEK